MHERARQQLQRLRHAPWWLQDLALAVLVSQADLAAVLIDQPSADGVGAASTPVPAAVSALVVLLIALPLVFRRHAPVLVMCLTGFGAGSAAAAGVPVQALAPLVALYTVSAYGSLRDAVISTGVFLGITTGLVLTTGGLGLLYANTLLVIGVAVVGRLLQAYRSQAAELAVRAAALERTREQRADLAVRAERARIAREMHDVLAHSTSLIVVQAAGARRLLREQPERVEEVLGVIERTGRGSLAEMRRLLGLLREEGEAAGTTPQPGLADVPDLVQAFAAAGMPVVLRPAGRDEVEPDPIVALSAYRIVQEALTNVLKHTRATRVTVDLRRLPGRVEVEVLDDGVAVDHWPAGSGSGDGGGGDAGAAVGGGVEEGFGVLGMRERAALVGGRFEAGPRRGGGYRVAAVLPLATAHTGAAGGQS